MKHIQMLLIGLCFAFVTSAPGLGSRGGVAPAPKAGTLFMVPERIKLQNGGFADAERGMMFVPLTRTKEASTVIAVEVYRFEATSPAESETPPIFFVYGGPGFDGLDDLFERSPGYYERLIQPKLDVADVVIVSQRGIGPSLPNTIIDTTLPATPLDRPFDNDKRVAALKEIMKRERDSWHELGVDLTGFNVIEAAEDLNDVRKALGYKKITLWGGSFGSHHSMALMRLHPEAVERAILWGMEGPDHTYDHPGHIWNVYKRVAADAEASSALQSYIPEGGLIQAVDTLIAQMDEAPITITAKGQQVLIDGYQMRILAQGYSDGGLASWPADIITMARGDFSGAAAYLIERRERRRQYFSTASFYMLDCGSGITDARRVAYEADPGANIVAYRNWTYSNACPVWRADLGDGFRQNFETDIPTVIVQGTWDLATPYENALELAPFFKEHRLIPVDRGPHHAIRLMQRQSDAISNALLRFAKTGDMSGLPSGYELQEPNWKVPVQQ